MKLIPQTQEGLASKGDSNAIHGGALERIDVVKTYMAIDQYGQTEHNLGLHPRKELLRRCNSTRAFKQYQDLKDGSSVHTGWIIAGRWFTLYHVERMERPTNCAAGVHPVPAHNTGGAHPVRDDAS
jgi:hypothetical protein